MNLIISKLPLDTFFINRGEKTENATLKDLDRLRAALSTYKTNFWSAWEEREKAEQAGPDEISLYRQDSVLNA